MEPLFLILGVLAWGYPREAPPVSGLYVGVLVLKAKRRSDTPPLGEPEGPGDRIGFDPRPRGALAMKTVSGWKDLEPYGILPLTGEACGLMYRILCDVTEPGAAIFRKCFGLARGSVLGEAWNRGTAEAPHVGSVMLSQESLVPLGIFALLESGCTEAYVLNGIVIGLEVDDPPDTLETMCRVYKAECWRRFRYGGTAGDRNVHQMSGRTE
jgi:hypothetical protein